MMKNKKNPKKVLKKQIKNIKRWRKKVATTLDWMDVHEILDDMIILKRDKRMLYVKGIKVTPHQIFLDDPKTQAIIVDQLRMAHNKILCPLWWGYVFTPVNLNEYMSDQIRAYQNEIDPMIRDMIEDDMQKAEAFMEIYRELEFFIMVRGKNMDELQKNYMMLYSEIERAGMKPKDLNATDFKNYLAYLFENKVINDYYFSEGIFTIPELDKEGEL